MAHYEYDPFGKTIAATGTLAAYNPMKFSTKYAETDALSGGRDSGVYYYGMRYFGDDRFLSRDPSGEGSCVNVYNTNDNDCINYIDPLGLKTIQVEFNAFIPNNIGAVIPVANAPVPGVGWFPDPNRANGSTMVATDNRSAFGGSKVGSSRMRTYATLNTDDFSQNNTFQARSDNSHNIQVKVTTTGRGATFARHYSYIPNSLETDQAAPTITQTVNSASKTSLSVTYTASASYPLAWVAPGINVSVTWHFCTAANGKTSVWVEGTRNAFPAYEAVVDGHVIYSAYPNAADSNSGPSATNLGAEWWSNTANFNSGVQQLP